MQDKQNSLYSLIAFLPLAAGLMKSEIFVKMPVQPGKPTRLQAFNTASALRQLLKYSRLPALNERWSRNEWRRSKENTYKHESAGIVPFPACE